MRLFTILLALVLALAAFDAGAARRLGGGGSIGRQSSNVTQRQAPARPATQDAAQSTAPAAGGLAATPQRRPWGGILGGLAAGLGLAWLANSLGLGPAFGQFLLFLLLAIVLMALWAAFMRRRMSQASGPGWQGSTAENPLSPRGYNPAKIGNDASARPWESTFGAPVTIGSALEQPPAAANAGPGWSVPPGFDTAGFLAAAKRNFVTLQDAWDRGDLKGLRSLMTDEMLREVGNQLADRERQPATGMERTEVVMLEAQLLGIEDLASEYMASVEFSGMLREDPSAGPSPFREVWNMTKPRDGSAGWLVAGVQALQ